MIQNTSVRLEELSITHKGILQTRILSAALKGRERQFMLLLLHNDDISRQACLAMLPKIDVDSLIARGFLKYKDSQALMPVPTTPKKSEETIDPILQLAAGMVY